MHRRPLLDLLGHYSRAHRGDRVELAAVARVRQLLDERRDCFDRRCLPGHVTASAWIVSADRRRFLLTHHRKLRRWLQLGGHADGNANVEAVALCEAQEESGLQHFERVVPEHGCPVVDVDVHGIPARPGEPAHEHHDVRFLLVAAPGQQLVMSDESIDLRWFEWHELEGISDDESLLRLGRKARALLAAKDARAGVPTGRAPSLRT